MTKEELLATIEEWLRHAPDHIVNFARVDHMTIGVETRGGEEYFIEVQDV